MLNVPVPTTGFNTDQELQAFFNRTIEYVREQTGIQGQNMGSYLMFNGARVYASHGSLTTPFTLNQRVRDCLKELNEF